MAYSLSNAPLSTNGSVRVRIGVGLLVVAATLATLLVLRGLAASQPDRSALGLPAPAIDLEALDGQGRVSSADFEGRVTVINAWASWCAPCREEAPVLRRVHERFHDAGVVFLGVANRDQLRDARAFVAEFEIPYRNAFDDGGFGHDYQVRGLPMTFVVDASGRVVARHFGPISETRLIALIEQARGPSGN